MATTNQAGTVIDRTSYEPYGKAIGETLDGVGYTGHVMDPVSGLVYMQQRYYDPVVGRFLSADPVTTDPNTGALFNRFNYANNNPYKFTDPDGREACALGREYVCRFGIQEGKDLPKPVARQGYESIGDGKVVRVDEVNHRGESRFEVHVYEDSKDFRRAAADRDIDGLRKHEINTLRTTGEWGKHGKESSAPDLGREGQRGFDRVVRRELNRRGLNGAGQLQARGFARFARFLGPAAGVVGYLGENSVNSVCSQGDPGGGVCD